MSTRVSVRFDQVGKNGEIQSAGNSKDGTAPPKLEGAGGDNILNTGLTAAPVVVVPTPQAVDGDESAAPRKSRKSAFKPVNADPGTLRRGLATMRQLASAPEGEPTASAPAENN